MEKFTQSFPLDAMDTFLHLLENGDPMLEIEIIRNVAQSLSQWWLPRPVMESIEGGG